MLNIYLMILSPGTYQGHNQLTLTLASLPNRREKKMMDSLKGDMSYINFRTLSGG